MSRRLDGQVAVVTGAGRGIGREIALALAREGARAALLARSAPEIEAVAAEIRGAGGTVTTEAVDLLDEAGVAAAFARVGPVDLLVNNAGAFAGVGPVWEVDPAAWWRDIETNLRGTFHACRAVLEGMRARRSGRIVNMVGGGTAAPFPYGSGYGTSKAGLMRFTESLAGELEGSGVVVLAMDPGLVRTRMTEYQISSAAGRRWLPRIGTMFAEGANLPPTRAAALAADIAAGRFDRLHGRLLMAKDDRDALVAGIDEVLAGDLRVLRITGP